MKLKLARIQNFKCIDDSEEFTISDITCLVGKNESGKTAVLQALYKLNAEESELGKFSDLEFPRRKWQPAMKESDLGNVLSTVWELAEEDYRAVEAALGIDVLARKAITVTKGYDNVRHWNTEFDEKKLVEHLLSGASLSAIEKNPIKGASSVKDIMSALQAIPELTENQQTLLAQFKRIFPKDSAEEAINLVLTSRLPKFLYFSEYYKLPGEVALEDFRNRKAENELHPGDYVFEALLKLAGTSAESIDDISTWSRLDASLDAVSNRLSDEIFQFWTQNSYLQVKFTFDAALPDDSPPFNSGNVFRTNIWNDRHRSKVNFNDRSTGFTWFFSFLVWFSQAREVYGDNLIILLDEPALNLHARAQADLLEYINVRLRPLFQVIYSTHSPFMIDPDNLLGTRTVEDVVQEERSSSGRIRDLLLGTKVSDDIFSVDRDTISPLQAAIGYDITRTLFIGKYTLIVEGPSDLLFLNWISTQLRANGRTGLDHRWSVCPVGGIDKVSSFAALFGGNNLCISVLVDFHKGEKTKIKTLKESRLLEAGRIYTAEIYAESPEADIEDIFGWENYVTLVNLTYGLQGKASISTTKPNEASRVVEYIENEMRSAVRAAVCEFDHLAPSIFLLENSSSILSKLPDLSGAMNRFERLIKDVNSSLPSRA